jgi:hypothetical protein
MKFVSAAVLALLAAVNVEEVSAIDTVKESRQAHRIVAKDDDSDSSSDSDSSDSDEDTFLMVRGDHYKVQDIGTGSLDKKYERVPPEHFASGSDDLFMKSMIMNYADEGKDCDEEKKDCKPNGQFTMTEAATRAAAAEVLATHKGLKGGAGAEYLKTYFERTWAHFDVNQEGRIGVETIPQFMRFLASDQTLNL